MNHNLPAPFPYYGGKRHLAQMIWDRFGAVDAYFEPFMGTMSEAAMVKQPPSGPSAESTPDASEAVRSAPVSVRLMPGSHVTLPRTFTKALGIQEGDNVVLRLEGDELRLYSRATAIKRMQKLVARRVPAGVKLADELIAERRREARREAENA